MGASYQICLLPPIQAWWSSRRRWSACGHSRCTCRPRGSWTAAGLAYLYVGGGVVGALASANLSTAMPATGAPAAVCALIGARAGPQTLKP